MNKNTVEAARALAKAIVDNGDLEEVSIYNITQNLADLLEDYDEEKNGGQCSVI
jgi:hypothetical protein